MWHIFSWPDFLHDPLYIGDHTRSLVTLNSLQTNFTCFRKKENELSWCLSSSVKLFLIYMMGDRELFGRQQTVHAKLCLHLSQNMHFLLIDVNVMSRTQDW